jgi:hypothetical protein
MEAEEMKLMARYETFMANNLPKSSRAINHVNIDMAESLGFQVSKYVQRARSLKRERF